MMEIVCLLERQKKLIFYSSLKLSKTKNNSYNDLEDNKDDNDDDDEKDDYNDDENNGD